MAHGRNTTVVAIRVADSVYTKLAKRANRRGLSVGDYIKYELTRKHTKAGGVAGLDISKATVL